MEDIIDAFAALPAGRRIADVAFDQGEPLPLRWRDQAAHFVQIAPVAGGEVVQSNNPLIPLEQGLQQVGADETGHSGHQPALGRVAELAGERVRGHGAISSKF